ncbi:MAG: glycosyltransferase family 2 protein [Chloroflexi bacterium]|nr:glycosyltransferase family 2 protein [Chloroflexota bacterium]MDA1147984.1 glycosyltransferase family 2 protein [Chloroflexota bacterium]
MTAPPSGRVTVVIPAFNEANRISQSLDRLRHVAPSLGVLEIVVVDDGSTDGTPELVDTYVASKGTAIRVVALPTNRGKGAAVRAGVAEARGDYVIFLDADLSAPPDAIPRAVAAIEGGADVAIGSRVTSDGRDARRTQPLRRQLSGRVFALLQRVIVGLPYRDTQCPFKLFSRAAAERLFPAVRTSGWAFDVELLARARREGFVVEEFPVEWQHVGGSHIRVGPLAALRVIAELISIRRRVGRAGRGAAHQG